MRPDPYKQKISRAYKRKAGYIKPTNVIPSVEPQPLSEDYKSEDEDDGDKDTDTDTSITTPHQVYSNNSPFQFNEEVDKVLDGKGVDIFTVDLLKLKHKIESGGPRRDVNVRDPHVFSFEHLSRPVEGKSSTIATCAMPIRQKEEIAISKEIQDPDELTVDEWLDDLL